MVFISFGCAISLGTSVFLVSLQAMQMSKTNKKLNLWSMEKTFVMVEFDFENLVPIYRFGPISGPCLNWISL
jgi:hypothetical protein